MSEEGSQERILLGFVGSLLDCGIDRLIDEIINSDYLVLSLEDPFRTREGARFMNSHSDTIATIWSCILTIGLSTIIVGWSLAFKEMQERPAWKPGVARFLLLQIVMIIRHPWTSLALHGTTLMLGPIVLMGLLINRQLFNLLDAHLREVQRRREQEWQEREGIAFRICCPEDAREYNQWLQAIAQAEVEAAAFTERLSVSVSRFISYATLVLGLLMAPFGIGVKKASAQQREGQTTEQAIDPKEASFDPGITSIHGAIGSGLTLLVPTSDENDPTLAWRLRQLDIKFLPRISPSVNATVVLGLAKLVDGPTDPVLNASIDWKPSGSVTVIGGRILSPIGLSRQAPPHTLIELTNADTGITAPFFEHGFVVTWTPTRTIEFKGGLLSGHGTSRKSDLKPDAVLLARVKPSGRVTLGMDFQTGKQDAGWRHVLGAHVQYDSGFFFGQAEADANFDAGQDKPTIGWYLLGVLRPSPKWEPYARLEWLHDLRPATASHDPIATLGVNFKPTQSVAVRAAVTSPLAPEPTIGLQLATQVAF